MKTYQKLSWILVLLLAVVPSFAQRFGEGRPRGAHKKGVVHTQVRNKFSSQGQKNNLPQVRSQYYRQQVAKFKSLQDVKSSLATQPDGKNLSEAFSTQNRVNNLLQDLEKEHQAQLEEENSILYFHRLGNEGKDPTGFGQATGDPYLRTDEWLLSKERERNAPAFSEGKRSFESLQLQASAENILPFGWQEMSRDELEQFINYVHRAQNMRHELTVEEILAAQQATPVTFEQLRQEANMWAMNREENFKWRSVDVETENQARQNPFFVSIRDNFLRDDVHYTQPWNEEVTSLRILIVNDISHFHNKFSEAAQQDPRITLDHAYSGEEAIAKIKDNPQAYDIVMTDQDMNHGVGTTIGTYVAVNKIPLPVVVLANASAMPSYWFKYGMRGRICVDKSPEEVFNFASNIVATGKAFPNK